MENELLDNTIQDMEYAGDIPEGWKWVKLGEIADVRDGTHDAPKETTDGKYLITSKHIKNGKIDFSKAYKISLDDFEAINKRSKVDKYDILFSMIGTIGEMVIVDFEPDFAIKNVGLFKTRNKDLSNGIYYYLKSNERS
jgi:Type I restriction modification DNA specificity domain.